MFDGSFKSKRTINLGGNKQQVDKSKLLRQAQEERRVREAERKRLKAAENIQAWYRGRTVAIKVRQDLRACWDQSISALLQSVQASSASPSRSPSASFEQLSHGVVSVTQKFLIFYRSQYDHRRLVQLSTLLILPANGTNDPVATVPFRVLSNRQPKWDILLRRLLMVLVKHLGDYPSWIENDSAPVLTLLDILTVPESFQSLQGPSLSLDLHAMFSQILFRSGIIATLSRFLLRIPLDDKGRPSIAKALLLSLRLCKTNDQSQDDSNTLDQFISHILTIPLLPNRMSIETLTTFTSRLPLDYILQRLSSTSCSAVASFLPSKITYLVANILAFCYQRIVRMNPAVSNAYLRVLTILLGMIPQDSIEQAPKAADDDEDMDDIEWRSEELPGTSNFSTPSSFNTNIDPVVLKWLSLAHDSNHLNDILRSMESALTPNGVQGEVLSAESIGQITQLLLNLITLFPSHKINILSNLMYFRFGGKTRLSASPGSGKFFGTSIIKIFLDAFMTTALYGQLIDSMKHDAPLSVELILNPAHEKSWSLLAFVSELYCQVLVTMGDDEFHDETRNQISLSSVITLSSVVKDVAFLLWWNDNALDMELNLAGSKNLKVGYLRDIVTKLTRQLHARDSRRSFCPKDHWLLSMPLNMSAFKKAVIMDEESLSRDREQEEMDGDDVLMSDANFIRGQRAINRRQKSSQLARLSPRLGVLNNIPFVIRFEDRVSIFREFVESDRHRTDGGSLSFQPHATGQARIRRGYVFEDGYEQLYNLGSRLKGRIAISFIDQYGIQEAGIDGGGVFKEFLTCLVRQAFDTNYGLFMNTSDQLLYPNPHSYAKETTQLKHYVFLGRILGKALYEGILIDAAFAGFFLAKCLGQVNYLDDLPSLDPDLYRGLMNLKNYDGDVEDMSLDFTVSDEESGQNISRNLVPNGSNIQVTRQNRIRYIYLMAHYRLNTQIDPQCRAFFHGLSDLIDPKWLWMFNQQELQIMLGGAQTAINLKDLEENVVYSNFKPTDPTIEYFWSVVQEMNEEDRRLLVKFITSCARPPLLGFKELNPKLCIRNAGQEEDRLPTSSTCMNLLKLPAFTSRQRLKEKLLYAIHSEAGFDLS
ncbi:hypothetical protein BGX27_007547 [Mortierella sp. AM989]|nr:hypothetical protein BGX27_007547 [Mortierella sp. AM989]